MDNGVWFRDLENAFHYKTITLYTVRRWRFARALAWRRNGARSRVRVATAVAAAVVRHRTLRSLSYRSLAAAAVVVNYHRTPILVIRRLLSHPHAPSPRVVHCWSSPSPSLSARATHAAALAHSVPSLQLHRNTLPPLSVANKIGLRNQFNNTRLPRCGRLPPFRFRFAFIATTDRIAVRIVFTFKTWPLQATYPCVEHSRKYTVGFWKSREKSFADKTSVTASNHENERSILLNKPKWHLSLFKKHNFLAKS